MGRLTKAERREAAYRAKVKAERAAERERRWTERRDRVLQGIQRREERDQARTARIMRTNGLTVRVQSDTRAWPRSLTVKGWRKSERERTAGTLKSVPVEYRVCIIKGRIVVMAVYRR